LNVSRTPNRRCALRIYLALLTVFSLAFALWVQALWAQKDQPPAKEYKIPPEAAARANPIKPSTESLAKGKKMYVIDCAMCHGDKGDGKGDMGADYKNMPDFSNPDTLKNRTGGELFYITRNGKGEMPAEDNRAKDDDIWNMVNYVRAFAKK